MDAPEKTILDHAKELVYGQRQESYGNVTDNFRKIATMWGAILGVNITPEQVGLCMVALKLSRQCHKGSYDNLVDACGYLATIEKMSIEESMRFDVKPEQEKKEWDHSNLEQ